MQRTVLFVAFEQLAEQKVVHFPAHTETFH
jgi:hypothetical protein